jgi:multiple sugar transport system substrate-binding protein
MATAALAALAALAASTGARADTPVTLRWALWDLNQTPYYKPLIDGYRAKHPNVTIETVDLGSTDYHTMLSLQLTGGANDLDVVTIKEIPGFTTLVRARQLADLTDHVKKSGIDIGAYGGSVEQTEIDGKIYAMPFRTDFWVLYYNQDLFDKAGVAYPGNDLSIAQFDALAKKLTSGMGSQKTYGAFLHTWYSTINLYGILDGRHTMTDGDYTFLKPWYERGLALQKAGIIPSYAQLKATNTHYSGAFFNNSAAMMPMGTWFIGTQIQKVKSGESKSTRWGIVKFPHPDGVAPGTTIGSVTLLSVNAASRQKEAALDFVDFVTGPQGAEIVADAGLIPALKSDAALARLTGAAGFPTDANSRAALVPTKIFLDKPMHPKSAQLEILVNRTHDAIMTETVGIDAGLAELGKSAKALLAQP